MDVVQAITAGASGLTGVLFANVFGRVQDEADRLLGRAELRAILLARKLVRMLAVASLAGIGIALLLTALFFALRESLDLSRATSFLVLALVAIAGGITLNYAMGKQTQRAHYGTHERD
jgi:hypothetical protein